MEYVSVFIILLVCLNIFAKIFVSFFILEFMQLRLLEF